MLKNTTYEERPTQEKQILDLLTRHTNSRVPLTHILRLGISQYNARIYGLRHKQKKNIINKIEVKNGKKHTFFKLVNG